MGQTPLWVTVMGFIIGPAVTVAILTFFFNRRLNREKAVLDHSVQERLNAQKSALDAAVQERLATQASALEEAVQERLNEQRAALDEGARERDARRDYEYDARKRLYEVTEPLLFQLTERADDLRERIAGLARTSQNGDLEPDTGWLSGDGYYVRTTIHRLISPVAIFQLVQDGLTLVDLNLDRDTRIQYEMLKRLAWTLTDHFAIAGTEPDPLPYNPYERPPNEVSRHFQGLPSGVVEAAGQSLIIPGDGRRPRVMRFGEFDDAYSREESDVQRACSPFANLLYGFHPRTHPVLWRTLIIQAHLCAAFVARQQRGQLLGSDAPGGGFEPWAAIPVEKRGDYDWRGPGDTATDREVLVVPFEGTKNFLRPALGSSALVPKPSPDTARE